MSYNDLIEDVPPLDQDEDSEEEGGREEFQHWNEDLASAKFYFLKTGKFRKAPTPGLVIADDENDDESINTQLQIKTTPE